MCFFRQLQRHAVVGGAHTGLIRFKIHNHLLVGDMAPANALCADAEYFRILCVRRPSISDLVHADAECLGIPFNKRYYLLNSPFEIPRRGSPCDPLWCASCCRQTCEFMLAFTLAARWQNLTYDCRKLGTPGCCRTPVSDAQAHEALNSWRRRISDEGYKDALEGYGAKEAKGVQWLNEVCSSAACMISPNAS